MLRFYTSKSEEELTSLDEYVENMGEKQNAIYYLATDSLKSAKSAPFLEKLVQKDIEVCTFYMELYNFNFAVGIREMMFVLVNMIEFRQTLTC